MSNTSFDPSLIESILGGIQQDEEKKNKKNINNQQIKEKCDNLINFDDQINKINEKVDIPQKINNINDQVNQLSTQLSQEKNDVISGKNGEVVNYNKVYDELETLIKYAKESLETLAAIEPDITDPVQISATASLINSIRGLVSEFSIIHRMNIKHKYNIELENIKQQHRLNTIEYKNEIKNQQTNNLTDDVGDPNGNNTIINSSIPWSNDLVLEFMEFMKQKGNK